MHACGIVAKETQQTRLPPVGSLGTRHPLLSALSHHPRRGPPTPHMHNLISHSAPDGRTSTARSPPSKSPLATCRNRMLTRLGSPNQSTTRQNSCRAGPPPRLAAVLADVVTQAQRARKSSAGIPSSIHLLKYWLHLGQPFVYLPSSQHSPLTSGCCCFRHLDIDATSFPPDSQEGMPESQRQVT